MHLKKPIDFPKKNCEKLYFFAEKQTLKKRVCKKSFFVICPLGLEHIMLNIPELLGEVHVVVVRIAETTHFIPHSGNLLLAMLADIGQRGKLIYQLAVLEYGNQ